MISPALAACSAPAGLTASCRRRQQLPWSPQRRPAAPGTCHASRKGRKGSGSGSGSGSKQGGEGGEPHRLMDAIRDSRQQQLAATDMLAKLLQAEQPGAVAAEYVDSLDEQFFWTVNTYLTMAKKEGEADVVSRLEAALKAAFEAKQATLRPEIQLLNRLLAAEGQEQRAQVLSAADAVSQLTMNERYFFSLLDRMLGDVRRQPEGAQRDELLAKLEAVRSEAEAAAAAAGAAS